MKWDWDWQRTGSICYVAMCSTLVPKHTMPVTQVSQQNSRLEREHADVERTEELTHRIHRIVRQEA